MKMKNWDKKFSHFNSSNWPNMFCVRKEGALPPDRKDTTSPVGLKPVREPLMISLFYKYLLYRLINSPAESKSNDCRESQGVVLGGEWFHNKTPFYLFPKP